MTSFIFLFSNESILLKKKKKIFHWVMRSTCSAAHLWPTVGQKRYFFATSFNFPGSHNAKLQVATRAMNYPLEVPEICSQRRLVVSTFYASHQASSFPAILHNLTNWQGAVARAHTHTHKLCCVLFLFVYFKWRFLIVVCSAHNLKCFIFSKNTNMRCRAGHDRRRGSVMPQGMPLVPRKP